MKILQITPSYYPSTAYGGPTVSIKNLCETIGQKHEVTVITTRANGKSELSVESGKKYQINNVNVRYFSRLTKDHTHFSIQLLKYLWCNVGKFDIIHIHSWWNLISIICALICWVKKKKFILSPRGTFSTYSIKNSRIRRKFINFCIYSIFKKTIFHVTSQKEHAELTICGIDRPIVCIANIIKLVIPHDLKPITDTSQFKILFLGRIHPVKNLETLIEALSKINFGYELNIAGGGDIDYVDSLKEKIKKASVNVKWLGEIVNDEIKYLTILESNIVVVLSLTENFSNVIIESLSLGIPVIVSKNVGLSNWVAEHDFGWITDYDIESVVKSLNQAYESHNKRRKINIEAPSKIRKEFGHSTLCKKYEDLYINTSDLYSKNDFMNE